MSVKAVVLMLLVIVALGLLSGPGLRRLAAKALGLRAPRGRVQRMGLAQRLGRAAGRARTRRG